MVNSYIMLLTKIKMFDIISPANCKDCEKALARGAKLTNRIITAYNMRSKKKKVQTRYLTPG